MLSAWRIHELVSGDILKEACVQRRYRYPEFDATQLWVQIFVPKISDAIVKSKHSSPPHKMALLIFVLKSSFVDLVLVAMIFVRRYTIKCEAGPVVISRPAVF
jgi:hypothetical protein